MNIKNEEKPHSFTFLIPIAVAFFSFFQGYQAPAAGSPLPPDFAARYAALNEDRIDYGSGRVINPVEGVTKGGFGPDHPVPTCEQVTHLSFHSEQKLDGPTTYYVLRQHFESTSCPLEVVEKNDFKLTRVDLHIVSHGPNGTEMKEDATQAAAAYATYNGEPGHPHTYLILTTSRELIQYPVEVLNYHAQCLVKIANQPTYCNNRALLPEESFKTRLAVAGLFDTVVTVNGLEWSRAIEEYLFNPICWTPDSFASLTGKYDYNCPMMSVARNSCAKLGARLPTADEYLSLFENKGIKIERSWHIGEILNTPKRAHYYDTLEEMGDPYVLAPTSAPYAPKVSYLLENGQEGAVMELGTQSFGITDLAKVKWAGVEKADDILMVPLIKYNPKIRCVRDVK